MKTKILLAFMLLTFSISIWSSELYTPQAILHAEDEKAIATVKFNTPETGDMYVAVIVGSKWLFLNQENSWSETPTPFKVNETFQGEYPLFSVDAVRLPPGNYPLYQIVTEPNGNPFDVDDWIGGKDGLNFLSFSTGLPTKVRVLPFNDLGMHCMSGLFSIFAILPPFNVVNAQVIGQGSDGMPKLLDGDKVEVRYSAVADRRGSINSSSVFKTDFWQDAPDLFGMDLQLGAGLTGLFMPADNPTNPGEQLLHYKSKNDWFSADGIPITPLDDIGQVNSYPMLRVSAYDKESGGLLGATDVVVPVSMEVNCKTCHATGKIAANDSSMTWISSDDPDVQAQTTSLGQLEVEAQKNVLLLHDKKQGTNLMDNTPVLCASCHYSAASDLSGSGPQGLQQYWPTLSQVIHQHHGEQSDAEGNPIIPIGSEPEQSCYQCHPGKTTQCQRGAMKTAGLECHSCHGDILAVGGKFPLQENGSIDGKNDGKPRRPWTDMPRCQSCHTGDAINHLTGEGLEFHEDGIRLVQAYKTGDQSASPLLAENKRFAENENTLFRNSKGHKGVACEGCHGSTHAIWPNAKANANDNLTALQLQGHTGTIIECDTCHTPGSLPMTLDGPHGIHSVNDPNWIKKHKEPYVLAPNDCKACHGKNLQGTALSKVAATRTFEIEDDRTITLEKGQKVSCDLCHSKP